MGGSYFYRCRSPEGKVSFRIGFAAYDTAIYFFNLKVRMELSGYLVRSGI